MERSTKKNKTIILFVKNLTLLWMKDKMKLEHLLSKFYFVNENGMGLQDTLSHASFGSKIT